ncbi:MAG: helix-turn-helix transcriptional regulator [Coprobacillus sp.]|nr:helix-turn-helix transcriptional regulator [Coprobacillus sp.]
MLLSDILKDEMKTRGLEINDIAETTGLTYQKIYSYVNGSVPRNKDLKIVCDAVGVNVDDVTFDELNISVTECARTMGKANNFVKAMVKHGVFGFYDGSTYHIPRKKFEKYMGLIDDPSFNEFVGLLGYAIKDIVAQEIEKATAGTVTN